MMKNARGLIALLAFVAACKNQNSTPEASKTEAPSIGLEKSWVMSVGSASNLPPKNEGSPAQRRMYDGWYGEQGRIGFSWHLFPGGTAVELCGQQYKEGKWAAVGEGNKAFSLSFPGEKEETATVAYLALDSMSVTLGEGKKAKEYGFKNDGARYDNPEQNPFHPVNNRWRVKPAAAETDEQLRARIKNHFQHMALILEGSLKHQLKVVSFRASPSCVQQYNGGIGLVKEADLPESWHACFFDKNDSKKAYKMIEKELKSGKKAQTSADNSWVANNLAILRRLEGAF